jgi:hypothetical protein
MEEHTEGQLGQVSRSCRWDARRAEGPGALSGGKELMRDRMMVSSAYRMEFIRWRTLVSVAKPGWCEADEAWRVRVFRGGQAGWSWG